MRLRRGWFGAWLGAIVIVAACDGFEAQEPVAQPDAGIDAAPDAPPINDAATVDGDNPVADAGACLKCRSGQCYDDGGCFPVVFVTKELYPGNFNAVDGGLAALARADEVCTLAGNGDASVPTQWRAWLSTSGETAISRVTDGFSGGSQRPVVDTRGVRIANSYLDLVQPEGGLLAPLVATQNGGVAPTSDIVWTGTTPAGKKSGQAATQCIDWTAGSGFSGRTGYVGALDGGWTDGHDDQCQNPAHLYCFEVIP